MNRHWKIWLVFSGVAFLGLASLVVLSFIVISLSQNAIRDSAEDQHGDQRRLAISNMEAWLLPLLSREADREPQQYQPFYQLGTAFNQTLLNPISLHQFVVPSPLLTSTDQFVLVHFELNEAGDISSPEVPTRPSYRDLAEAAGISPLEIDKSKKALVRVKEILASLNNNQPLLTRITEMENFYTIGSERINESLAQQQLDIESENFQSATEPASEGADLALALDSAGWVGRSQRAVVAQSVDQDRAYGNNPSGGGGFGGGFGAGSKDGIIIGSTKATVGGLVPLWQHDTTEEHSLLYVRRYIRPDGEKMVQGLLVDWPALQAALLEQIVTPLNGARFEPWQGAPKAALIDAGFIKAGLPSIMAELIDDGALITIGVSWSTTTLILVICWIAAAVAFVAVGLMLRSSVLYGERRSMFASAVTHELRTPLTTFRMYSEMLADGLITEPSKRQQYLETLRSESDRLSGLVENVLAYARLEEGRHRVAARRVEFRQLIESLRTLLSRRCDAEARPCSITVHGSQDAELYIDVESLEQVLFNLIDNACKYGINPDRPEIEVDANLTEKHLSFEVRDYGPGINHAQSNAIFKAFDRGERASDPAPGIGLGLALARQMAASMGGHLVLREDIGEGAMFELTIPLKYEP
ncbi:MAG: HAMP domain-containing sensor histidine kinase [Phycisphaerales bacterium]|nr:HAMP domain-containing sensor histidine kinase [Phycisphaerales bacterium]